MSDGTRFINLLDSAETEERKPPIEERLCWGALGQPELMTLHIYFTDLLDDEGHEA